MCWVTAIGGGMDFDAADADAGVAGSGGVGISSMAQMRPSTPTVDWVSINFFSKAKASLLKIQSKSFSSV